MLPHRTRLDQCASLVSIAIAAGQALHLSIGDRYELCRKYP